MHYKILGEWLNITIDDTFPFSSLSDFLDYFQIGNKQRKQWLNQQTFYLNHLPIQDLSVSFRPGEQLRLHIFQKEKIDYPPEHLFDPEIVYEDRFCLVVNKPAGYIVHDAHQSLANVIAWYYQTQKIQIPVRYIHRLDKETSGLVFFSKCPFFQPYFDWQIQEKIMTRQYLALVEGMVPWEATICEQPIGKDRHHNNRYGVFTQGKPARTHFTCLKKEKNQSLLLCTLDTGRTHQIRVHLSHMGFPIVNDQIYGHGSEDQKMALCAVSLTWIDPLSQQAKTSQISSKF